METVESKYDKQARDAGVYIVCSCGFDSIPNDMGALMVQKSFNGDLAYVDSYVTLLGSNVSLTVGVENNPSPLIITYMVKNLMLVVTAWILTHFWSV